MRGLLSLGLLGDLHSLVHVVVMLVVVILALEHASLVLGLDLLLVERNFALEVQLEVVMHLVPFVSLPLGHDADLVRRHRLRAEVEVAIDIFGPLNVVLAVALLVLVDAIALLDVTGRFAHRKLREALGGSLFDQLDEVLLLLLVGLLQALEWHGGEDFDEAVVLGAVDVLNVCAVLGVGELPSLFDY